MRSLAMCTGTSNFFCTLSNAILILYMARTLHLSKLEIPIVFVASPAGSIAAGLFTSRVNRRIGVGPTILATIATSSVAGLCYPLAPHSFPLPLLMVGGALFGFGAVAYNITQVSLRQAITPERLQGRMNAAMRWVVWGTIPLGSLAGGGIATWWGLRTALWVGALGGLLRGPLAVSLLRTFSVLPFVLISLPAGVWIDRMRRRPLMIVADTGRALALASIPVAYWLGRLSLVQLYVVVAIHGTLSVFFDVSYLSFLPGLVPRERLGDANAKLLGSQAAAQVAGPSLAGALIG